MRHTSYARSGPRRLLRYLAPVAGVVALTLVGALLLAPSPGSTDHRDRGAVATGGQVGGGGRLAAVSGHRPGRW